MFLNSRHRMQWKPFLDNWWKLTRYQLRQRSRMRMCLATDSIFSRYADNLGLTKYPTQGDYKMSASAPIRQRTGSIMDALASKNQDAPLQNDIRIGGLSIVIPVHNRPELLRRCLESLMSLQFRPLQVIVVDDGSDDETPEMAEELVDNFRVRNIDLVVERTQRRGAPHARNWGTARSTCSFVMFMDSDD